MTLAITLIWGSSQGMVQTGLFFRHGYMICRSKQAQLKRLADQHAHCHTAITVTTDIYTCACIHRLVNAQLTITANTRKCGLQPYYGTHVRLPMLLDIGLLI